MKNRKTENKDIIFFMNNFIENLKRVNMIYTNADIELLKYGRTTYPNDLLIDEMNNRYCFFSIILGYIDSLIDNTNIDYNTIEFIRSKVIYDFIYNIKLSDLKIIKETLLEQPCYKNFEKCYTQLDQWNSKLILNMIKFYKIGYSNYSNLNIYKMYSKYIILYSDYNSYIINNKKITDEIRVKKKIL